MNRTAEDLLQELLSLGAAACAASAQWQMARALREWLGLLLT